jgi:hypothetical protein
LLEISSTNRELALQIERESQKLRIGDDDSTSQEQQLVVTLLNSHAKETLLSKEIARKV